MFSFKNGLRKTCIAAAASLLMAGSAFAESVVFSTVGTFSGSPSGTSLTAGGTIINGQFGTQLQYVPTSPGDGQVNAPDNATFGEFVTVGASTDGDLQSFAGTLFTLKIIQTVPMPGGDTTITGSITGSLKFEGGTLKIDFDNNPFQIPDPSVAGIPTVFYQVDDSRISASSASTNTTINGFIDFEPGAPSTPLPAAACGGLVLMGGLGLRRRNSDRA